jgi:uncharacterized protein
VRVTLDTNVLISAFISTGRCSSLFEYCAVAHTLVTSQFILQEFRQKLLGKFRMGLPKVEGAVALFFTRMELVQPAPLSEPVCPDPDDDWVLATAIAGRCRCIVTGDQRFLGVREHAGIQIVRPGDFWEFEKQVSGG